GDEFLARARRRPVAAARDHERARPLRIGETRVQRREAAHREARDMRAIDLEMVEYRDDVVARARLGVLALVLGRVGERIAAGVIRDAAVAAGEKPYQRLPAAVVPRALVHVAHAGAAAPLLLTD